MASRMTSVGRFNTPPTPPRARPKSPWRDKRHRWAAWFKAPDEDLTQLYYCTACGILSAQIKQERKLEFLAQALVGATRHITRTMVAQMFQPSPVYTAFMQKYTKPMAGQPTQWPGTWPPQHGKQ